MISQPTPEHPIPGPSRGVVEWDAGEGTRCPRCKREGPSGAERCTYCGYSFCATRTFDTPGGPAGSFETGDLVNDKYRILSILGEGGFGVVYQVQHVLLDSGNLFALKRLHPSLSLDAKFRRRFLREAALAMQLVHENTIQIREFGQTGDGHLFYTMDYCEGEPLHLVIDREGFLPVHRALQISLQILSVLELAHDRGIIHRDLKPENVFLQQRSGCRDFVKVGDFGLAKSIDGDSSDRDITRGGILGTPRYMSPEQAIGSDDLDQRSDLYSVGVMLYEMLYGDIPGERGRGEESTGDGDGSPGLDTPRGQPGQVVPQAVWRVVRKALAARREDRFQSAVEFAAAIQSLPAYTPSYLEPRQARRRGRPTGALRALATLLAVVLLAGGIYSVARSWIDSRPSDPERRTLGAAVSPEGTGPGEPALPPNAPARTDRAADVAGWVSLEVGDVFEYEIVGDMLPKGRRLTYSVVAEPAPGRFRVEVSPGERSVTWVIDTERNAFRHEFVVPDAETGELTKTETRDVLVLPPDGRPLREDFTSGPFTVRSRPASIPGRFTNCLVAEERSDDQVHYRYFQFGTGLVGLEVYEPQVGGDDGSFEHEVEPKELRLVYARYLVTAPATAE